VGGLIALYGWLRAPVRRIPSKDFHDPGSNQYIAMRRKFFPPGFPNGWHCVCNTTDLEHGRVKSISALGTYMVAFRGEDGNVGVLHAFCPHMGAHLGKGGTVVGNALRCPFHGWSFDAEGHCKHIPYRQSTRELPEETNTKAYVVRVILERVFIWFDAEGRPPQWELECHELVEAGLKDGSYYFADMRCTEFDMHCSEMHLNSADPYHFKTLHAPMPFPLIGHLMVGDHDITQEYGRGEVNGKMVDKQELCSITEKTSGVSIVGGERRWPLPFSASVASSIDTGVTFEGPTIVHFTVKTPFGIMRQINTLLSIEPFKQYTESRWYAERSVPRVIAKLMASIASRAVDQDRVVWENKIWRKKPKLVAGDGPFLDFFQWYDQFYSENSANVSRDQLEW